ncbi:MAG: TolC family protein [Planctomycetales bacterium]|nr:TolC family protein [Planctomycetales bacterium]
MTRQLHRFWAWTLIASVLATGCRPVEPFYLHEDGDLSHYVDVATDIEYTDVDFCSLDEVTQAQPPRTVNNPQFDSFWDLSLEEAVSLALNNSKVIRSYGQVRSFGQILGNPPERITSAPDGVVTVYDPAIQETGQTGVEQALANFDAVFTHNTTWDRRNRPQNFNAPTIFAQILQQDQVTSTTAITKRSAVGSQMTIRNVTLYEDSNQSARTRGTDVFTGWEGEWRQPLMRGRGTQVNRVPVVLARIRTDIALADFEFGVRNLVSEVERAYWELYFFYRNMYAAKIGHDSALATWQRTNALFEKGAPGGEAQNHARASEQYFFFRARVEEAARDVFKQENRLRYLLGLTTTDGRMVRPKDEPTTARVTFDWYTSLDESLHRSVELRRQKWRIKQREMELIGARNQLLPQVDLVGLYRFLGIGEDFDSFNRRGANFPADGSTAIDELLEGNYQEGQIQIDVTVPLGFRRELAQVRNQQLLMVREQARLEDMELEVTNQLTDAIQDLEAQYKLAQTNLNRRVHAQKEVEALKVAMDAGTATLDLLLDAQRRQADAEVAYYQSLIEYNLAIMNVHFRKGSLLDYSGVVLAEGPWPAKAYMDAHQRARQRDASYYLDYGFSRPNVISNGSVPQNPGVPDAFAASQSEVMVQGNPQASPFAAGDVIFDAAGNDVMLSDPQSALESPVPLNEGPFTTEPNYDDMIPSDPQQPNALPSPNAGGSFDGATLPPLVEQAVAIAPVSNQRQWELNAPQVETKVRTVSTVQLFDAPQAEPTPARQLTRQPARRTVQRAPASQVTDVEPIKIILK